MAHILIVDDEEPILELLSFNLEKEGYEVSLARNGDEALESMRKKIPDLVVLDLMLPGMDGLEVCRQMRQYSKFSEIPVIMLTAKGEEVDKIVGLELGADDYMTKPFSPRELVARIKARLRRMKTPETSEKVVSGDLYIDLQRFKVSVGGKEIECTPKEFELLKLLASHPGKVYSREELLTKIWGYEYLGDTRTVDVHIRHLRQKIEYDPSSPIHIETLRGIGYRYKN